MRPTDAAALARAGAVVFDLSNSHGLFRIEGPDAVFFAQSIMSNDISGQATGHLRHNALLNKQSGVVADFHLLRDDDALLLIGQGELMPRIAETLEYYHFGEDVTLTDATAETALLAVQGPAAPETLHRLSHDSFFQGEFVAMRSSSCEIEKDPVRVLSLSLTGDEGYVLIATPEKHARVMGRLTDPSQAGALPLCDQDALEVLRIEAGIPKHGRDMDESTRILDTGLDESILSFTKGCFPGQEVVARIRSRGEVSRKLVGLVFEGSPKLASGSDILNEDKQVGTLRSVTFSPHLEGVVAMAYLLKRISSKPGQSFEFTIDGQPYTARVVDLPFYASERIQASAARVCETAIMAYHSDDYTTAQERFEHALQILPAYTDALEGLGLTLERMGNADEAIRINTRYAHLHPAAVMPHTNLSRLYMFKGLKTEAEEEMAKATMLKFRETSGGAVDVAALAAEQTQQREAERERKLGIFNQVLEIDPEDEVANFGMGSILLDLEDYKVAIGHLRTVVANNTEYSAAYDLLGRALIAAGQKEEAGSVLIKGIEVASARGDLMPLKSMQQSKVALEKSGADAD